MNANSQLHTRVSVRPSFPASTVDGCRFATRADIAKAFQERLIARLQDLAEAAGSDADPDEEEWELGEEEDEEWELGDDEDSDDALG